MSTNYEWLSLMDISGPFLAVPVLKEVFPQGLEGLDPGKAKRLQHAYEEWRDAVDVEDPGIPDLHRAWIDEVLTTALEMERRSIRRDAASFESLKASLPEQGVDIGPDIVIVDGSRGDAPLLPIHAYEPEFDLESPHRFDGFVATPLERMSTMLRATGRSLGLATNGEKWTLIYAPEGKVATFASWYARLWSQESETLRAFASLLGIRRFYGPEEESLPSLFERSMKFQDEVTNALGEQVRRAVEVLVQSIDRADQDRNRELLRDIREKELYEAALTIMMRLVFLLAAEERGLLLLGDPSYEANYAVSTLRMQLRIETEEILERRRSAWSRLLALFRAIYGGVEHPSFRLPALGGSLFDPDRYAFLEGRSKGTSWKNCPAAPLPIDDRTVLLLLEAIQNFEGRTLSYRALDVEQIGHVYEGLLERTVRRITDTTLELDAVASAKDPRISLGELESAALKGRGRVIELLKERSGRVESAIGRSLDRKADDQLAGKLLTVCHGNAALRDRILPYIQLLRTDPWGYPLVHGAGSFVVVMGADRRETGTHYTPKSLTEKIVKETITPLVFLGPAEGSPPEEWILKRSTDLLDLKFCDPAMGSGAFLVQTCRFLSEKLVEAWAKEEAEGLSIDTEGRIRGPEETYDPLPRETGDRAIIARRLIAERCLYGVDLNPMAVELAKLSLWLVTLAKNRPFGFLDHNLRSGDSLLGMTDVHWWKALSLGPLFEESLSGAVRKAMAFRAELRTVPLRDMRDVDLMRTLDARARVEIETAERIADAITAIQYGAGTASERGASLTQLGVSFEKSAVDKERMLESILPNAHAKLAEGTLDGKPRRPFHWSLEYPEVFQRENGGFDAIVGNPPFLGNRLWNGAQGTGLSRIVELVLEVPPGKIDLCIAFHRRAVDLIRDRGCYGLLATSNIAEGSAIKVGLREIVKRGDIYFSRKGMPWPGSANVFVAIVCFHKGAWAGTRDATGAPCGRIGSRLTPEDLGTWEPKKIDNGIFSFEGVNNSQGLAFVITSAHPWFERLKSETNSLLRPYITGDDITSHALHGVDRWALDVADRSLEEIEEKWPIAYRFLADVVQPTRTIEALDSYSGLYERWWQFWNHRATDMKRLRKNERFIAYSKVTKYPVFMMASSTWIYTNQVVLIGIERDDMQAICLSSLFRAWMEAYCGGSLGLTFRISISESIAKYPIPASVVSSQGIDAASKFDDLASMWAMEHESGLTDVMNAINDPEMQEDTIVELRSLLPVVDAAVCEAYGWTDVDTTYDFIGFPDARAVDRWRFSIGEESKEDILARLSQLNRQRYETEMARKGSIVKSNQERKRTRHTFNDPENADGHPSLDLSADFSLRSDENDHASDVLKVLEESEGWCSKADIVATLGIDDHTWNTAISDLLDRGLVERQGERRGTRYRLTDRKDVS